MLASIACQVLPTAQIVMLALMPLLGLILVLIAKLASTRIPLERALVHRVLLERSVPQLVLLPALLAQMDISATLLVLLHVLPVAKVNTPRVQVRTRALNAAKTRTLPAWVILAALRAPQATLLP